MALSGSSLILFLIIQINSASFVIFGTKNLLLSITLRSQLLAFDTITGTLSGYLSSTFFDSLILSP